MPKDLDDIIEHKKNDGLDASQSHLYTDLIDKPLMSYAYNLCLEEKNKKISALSRDRSTFLKCLEDVFESLDTSDIEMIVEKMSRDTVDALVNNKIIDPIYASISGISAINFEDSRQY